MEGEFGKGLLYEVPEELRHEERVLWVFSLRQLLILLPFAIVALACFLGLENLDFKARLAIPAIILFAGYALACIKPVQEAAWRHVKYLITPRRTSWREPLASAHFVGVEEVKANAVFTSDGHLLSVLLVTPLDYSVLGEDQKHALVYGYRSFLNAISFPVQVVMRTTKVNLKEYFAKAKAKAAKAGDSAALLEISKFEQFVEDFISSRGVNDRLFYLVIPQEKGKDLEKSLRELENKTAVCCEKLAAIGIACRRLDDNSLVSLYASFFGGFVEAGADYLSLLTFLDFAQEQREKLEAAGAKMRAKAVFIGMEVEQSAGKTVWKEKGRTEAQGKAIAVPAGALKH
jgi:hypothetical protein